MTVILGLGTEKDSTALKLETRLKRFIRNTVRLEAHPMAMKERVRITQSSYPSVRPVAASAIYNCYGMVFAARRTAIVDEDDIEAILLDDGYRRLPWDPAAWLVGDIVLYKNDKGALTHAGMIAAKIPKIEEGRFEVEVLSTWGESGEYLHPISVVSPLLGRPAAVYSQRFLL